MLIALNVYSLSLSCNPYFSNFFLSALQRDVLKDHLTEEVDYALVPKAAWELLHGWYGLSQGSRPIKRLSFIVVCT